MKMSGWRLSGFRSVRHLYVGVRAYTIKGEDWYLCMQLNLLCGSSRCVTRITVEDEGFFVSFLLYFVSLLPLAS